jgi:hypothetical protein
MEVGGVGSLKRPAVGGVDGAGDGSGEGDTRGKRQRGERFVVPDCPTAQEVLKTSSKKNLVRDVRAVLVHGRALRCGYVRCAERVWRAAPRL